MKLLSSQTTTKETKKFQLFSDFPNINLEVISENNKIKNAKLKGKGIHKSYPYFYKPEFKEIIKKEHPWILDRNRNYPIEKYMINPISLLENEELIKPENFYFMCRKTHSSL